MDDLQTKCEEYLYFSSLPRFSEVNLDWLKCDFESDFGKGHTDEAWWINEGVCSLRETLAEEIATIKVGVTHILPLSGGLDSRAILGGLLENLPKSQIIAATYGIPGAWDFEISKNITHEFGLQHEVFNLLDEKWDLDQLLAAAKRLKKPVSVYQSYVRQKINNHFGIDCIYWSGFLGGTLTGSNLPKIPSPNKREAIKNYLNLEPTPNYQDLRFQSMMIDKIIVEIPWERLPQTKFTLDQILNYGLRQAFLTYPIVIMNGFTFKTPFLAKRWVTFMSNVPYKWLLDKYLYKLIIQKSYPELAKLPSIASAGRPLLSASKYEIFLGRVLARIKPYLMPQDPYHSHPRTNYINWTEALRHKGNLQNTVRETLEAFKKRTIFKKELVDTWWLDHLKRKKDYTALLMNLSSLELLLQAGVM